MSLRGYGVIVAAFFTVSIAYAIRYGYGMLLPGMLVSMDITKTEAGIIYGTYFGAYTVFSPLLGVLSDKYDSRLILTCFTALLASGAMLMAQATTVLQASFIFALAGIGHAACWVPVVSLVQQWVDDRHRGTALAIATMGSGIGIAAWSILLPGIVERLNWQAGWIYMGAFGFVVAGINFLLVRNPAPETAGKKVGEKSASTAKTAEMSYRQLLGSVPLWLVGCSYMMIGFTVLVPFTFLGVYAAEELHLPYATATGFFTLMAVAGMAGKLILGVLSDKWGRIQVMMLCGLFLGIGCWGIVNFEDLQIKICCTVLVGFGFGAVWPVYAAAAIDFFPKSVAGSVIGLWTFFLGVGSILSPIVCGWSIDFSGSYTWAFNIGFVVAMISVVLLLPLFKYSGSLQSRIKTVCES